MTTEAMLDSVLVQIRGRFYQARDREYFSQRRHLMKAILNYAFECEKRGWQFQNHEIASDVISVLQKTRRQDFEYLPAYLHEAVRKHVNYRAEELNAKSKSLRPKLSKVFEECGVAKVIVEKSDTEIAAALYKKVSSVPRTYRPPVKPLAIQQELAL